MEKIGLQKQLKQKDGSGLMAFREAGFKENAVRLGMSPRMGSHGKPSSPAAWHSAAVMWRETGSVRSWKQEGIKRLNKGELVSS